MRQLIFFLLITFSLKATPWSAKDQTPLDSIVEVTNSPSPIGIKNIDDPKTIEEIHPDNLTEMALALHAKINAFRKEHGKAELTFSEIISKHSQRQTDWVAVGRYPLGHQGANLRYKALRKQIDGVISGAENIARIGVNHVDPIDAVFSGWIMGPGHRSNILGDFDLCGYGISKTSTGSYYFNQFFIRTETSE